MRRVSFVVPGDLATPTGGYAYDRRIIAELRHFKWDVRVVDVGAGFPRPSAQQKAAARDLLAALPPQELVVLDGLAFGVLPEAAEELAASHRLVALVHHPLAYEPGLPASDAESFRASERRALATVRAAIVTSHPTGRLLEREYGVPAERIAVVQPGNDPVTAAPRETRDQVLLLSVGSVVPGKGYDVLVDTLTALHDLPWRLTIAGSLSRDSETVDQLRKQIDRAGLSMRITLAGALSNEELAKLYASVDLFVLASRFEGYGMAISEATTYGLPVISTTAGAIPETLRPGTGLLVPPDDVEALSAALRQLIEQPSERQRLGAAARDAARSFPTWRESGELFSKALEAIA